MTTFKKPGYLRRYTNSTSATIAANTLVILRSGTSGEVGVTIDAIAAGEVGDVATAGEHELTAATGAVSAHALVYRAASGGAITTTSSGNTLAGVAVAAKSTAATTIRVLLNNRCGSDLSD